MLLLLLLLLFNLRGVTVITDRGYVVVVVDLRLNDVVLLCYWDVFSLFFLSFRLHIPSNAVGTCVQKEKQRDDDVFLLLLLFVVARNQHNQHCANSNY